MLDYRRLRNEPEFVKESLAKRGYDPSMVDEWLAVDTRWRELTTQVEQLTAEQNRVSKEIPQRKKAGEDVEPLLAQMRALSDQIKQLEAQKRELEAQREQMLLMFPNIPHASTPIGTDASQNVEVRRGGQPHAFSFEPKPHWEIAENLGLIDFERAAKISGSGFMVYTGLGARLERALINFMLDLHVREHGYTEIFPPFLVRPEVMVGTGQLPKFEEEMYRCADDPLYLIPTAEVPVTNLYREEILNASELPLNLVAYSPCFRREAGAAGRLTRGLLRVHQFNKVELVKLTLPETSYEEHERLLRDAETVLQRLELPYRIMLLCTGDLGFAAAKCYDLEVWSPGVQQWLEVSSCSNFEDFQARRANIRFRREPTARPEFVHTLNASGVATPRLMAAILENYQQEDGSVVIPHALRPYMDGLEVIRP
ncbi:MAG: serine--tRNA ligase [Fimbriimonadales bacterium]|nr:serine--tRNA ligase [Armatimonadota bacterium]MCX7687445.1 serine--tRNA ligase [Fimbriimonadales bacterium]